MRPSFNAVVAVLACATPSPPAEPEPPADPEPVAEPAPDHAPVDAPPPPPLAESAAAWPTDVPDVDLVVHVYDGAFLVGASDEPPSPIDADLDPHGLPPDLGRHHAPGLAHAASERSARRAALWIAPEVPYAQVGRAAFSLGFAGADRLAFALSTPEGLAWIPLPLPTLSDEPSMARAPDRCITRTVTVRGDAVSEIRQIASRPPREDTGSLVPAMQPATWTFEDLDAEPSPFIGLADYQPVDDDEAPCPRVLVTASPSTTWQAVVLALDRLHAAGHEMPVFALPIDD